MYLLTHSIIQDNDLEPSNLFLSIDSNKYELGRTLSYNNSFEYCATPTGTYSFTYLLTHSLTYLLTHKGGINNEPYMYTLTPTTINPSSRLDSDYERVSVIGTGTFGQVFCAKSKVDGCLYAIKMSKMIGTYTLSLTHAYSLTHSLTRSYLWTGNGKSSMEKMMNEVKALAVCANENEEFNAHIVRYYTSW